MTFNPFSRRTPFVNEGPDPRIEGHNSIVSCAPSASSCPGTPCIVGGHVIEPPKPQPQIRPLS